MSMSIWSMPGVGGSGKGGAVIGGSESGGRRVAGRILSCIEVSQLDDDVLPPSNCWITLLLVTSADLLLE
jgi:hypothetical protein